MLNFVKMKKVLIITYYWPPAGGSGVQRWMYFGKYLKEFGHEVTVLTVDPKYATYASIDNSLLEQVKDIPKITTKSFEFGKLYSRIVSKDSRKGIPSGNIENKNSAFQRFARFVRGNFFVPDSRVGWVKYAVKSGQELLRKNHFDVIITTGPPHSTHLIGQKLKQKMNVKWIADFRDPWTEVYYNKLFYQLPLAKKKDLRLEKMIINEADYITTIGQNMCKLLKSKATSPDKISYIYNGFDENLLRNANEIKSSSFDLVFTGLLSKNQDFIGLLKTLQAFERDIVDNSVRFILAGNIDKDIILEFKNNLNKIKVDYLGYVPHQKAIELMKNATVLTTILADLPNNEIMISGKIMEYISTGNPILLFGPKETEANILVKKFNQTCVSNKYRNECVLFMSDLYKRWSLGEDLMSTEIEKDIHMFTRRETARELSVFIESM